MRRQLPNGLSTSTTPQDLHQERAPGGDPISDAAPHVFNVHGLFSVKVLHKGLRAVLDRELSAFRSDDSHVDLVVEEGEPDQTADALGLDYSYGHDVLVVETATGRIQLADGLIRAEPRVSADILLSQYVENYMQQTILPRGACIVHASAVSRNGVGLLLPAWRHTGKTAVALEFVAHGYAFMSDDWSIVTSAGELLAYPRWLRLFQYNFELHPFLAQNIPDELGGRQLRRSLLFREFASSLKSKNRFAAWLQRAIEDRFYPYALVPVSTAIPQAETALRARLAKACLLTSSIRGAWTVEEIPVDLLARKMAASASYERTSLLEHGLARLYAGGGLEPRTLYQEYVRVLGSALQNAVCLEMKLPARLTSINFKQIEAQLDKY